MRNAKNGALLGGCELKRRTDSIATVSYWVHPRHRRKGVASRAVGLLTKEIARTQGFFYLELITDCDNLASRGVARNCGYPETSIRNGQLCHLLKLPPAARQSGQPNAG